MNKWEKIWKNRDVDRITTDYLLTINGFSSKVASFEGESFDLYFNNIFKNIELNQVKSCFEIGCGAGLFLYKLPMSIKKYGIDYSDKLISIAKKILTDADLKVQDADKISTLKKYDLVFSHSVFQYFETHKYANSVLNKMVSISTKYILILDVLDESKYENYVEMRKKYNGDMPSSLNHLPFNKNFFNEFGAKKNLDVKIIDNLYTPNENSKYRFNVIFSK